MNINAHLHTDGKGYWSTHQAEVHCFQMDMNYLNEEKNFGELIVFFRKDNWDTSKLGLIYTDLLWQKEFRNFLVSIGFSKDAASDVEYSEQGMQGEDYVSLDVGKYFISEWIKLNHG